MLAKINFKIRIVPADGTSAASGRTVTSAYHRFVQLSGKPQPAGRYGVVVQLSKRKGASRTIVSQRARGNDIWHPTNTFVRPPIEAAIWWEFRKLGYIE